MAQELPKNKAVDISSKVGRVFPRKIDIPAAVGSSNDAATERSPSYLLKAQALIALHSSHALTSPILQLMLCRNADEDIDITTFRFTLGNEDLDNAVPRVVGVLAGIGASV